jgi:acyl-CoA dehydrogenase
MFLDLPQQTNEVLDGLRKFVESVAEPRITRLQPILDDPHQLYGADGRFHPDVQAARSEIRLAAAEAGYYQMFTPESVGGGGLDMTTLYAVWHDLYRHAGMRNWIAFDSVSHWATGPSHLLESFTQEAMDAYHDRIMSGHVTLCFAVSESDAGSDLWRMQARAEHTADGWLLNGEKQWITNGPYADIAIVFAVTDVEAIKARRGGISAFLVPMDSLGASVSSVLKLYGHAGSNEATLAFHDVALPAWSLLGDEGNGLELALSGTSVGRIYNSARSIGLAAWALQMAVEYTTDRITFGQRVIDHQGVGFALAEAATETLAAHLLGLHAAATLDRGDSALVEAALAKSYSTETAVKVIDRAVQALGGMGITNEVGLSQAWQEIRAVCIADGSAEMMRRLLAKQLSHGRVRF